MRERDDGRAGDGDPDVARARADAGARAVGGVCAVVVTRAMMVDVFVCSVSTGDAVAVEGACGGGGRRIARSRLGSIALGLSSRVMMMTVTDGVCVV